MSGDSPTATFATILLVVGFAGVPLVIAPGLVLEYEVTPKLCLLLGLTFGLLLCWRAWLPGAVALLGTGHGRLFACVLGAQILSLTVATLASRQPALSLAGSTWRRYGLLTQCCLAILSFMIAAFLSAHREALTKLAAAIAAATGLVSAYAIAQYAGWDPFLPRARYILNYGGEMLRPPASLGHAVYLGSFLCAAIPVVGGLAAGASGVRKHLLRLIGVASIAAMILSGSRSALLGLAAGALLSLWISGKKLTVRARFLVPACIALASVILIFLQLPASASFRLRLKQWQQDAWGGPRLLVWRDSLTMAAASPAVGFGPETFRNEFRKRQSAELSRAYPEFSHESPHNVLIEGVLAQGLPYLLVALGIGYLVCQRGSAEFERYAVWYRAGAIGVLVSLLFIPVTIVIALMLYSLLAFLIALRAPGRGTVSRSCSGFVRVAAYSLAGVLLVAAVVYARQDLAYARLADAGKSNSLGAMTEAYEAATDAWFPLPGQDLWCSREFSTFARGAVGEIAAKAWAVAAIASARAETTSDTSAEAAFQSALLAIGRNDAAKAMQKLEQAIRDAPTWYKPHLLRAQLLRFTGRTAEAQAEAQAALDLAGQMRSNVEQSLRN